MIKVVIFDADGVLIQGKYFAHFLERDYGIKYETTQEFFLGVFKECVIGKKDLRIEIVPYLDKWGWKGTINDFIDYWHKMEHNIDRPLVEYIQNLRKTGITCCLATNQHKERFEYMIHEMEFGKFFDKLYASSHLRERKPNLKYFHHVINDLNKDPDEILFWDDLKVNVEAARQAGMHAEVYTDFNNFKTIMKNYGFGVS